MAQPIRLLRDASSPRFRDRIEAWRAGRPFRGLISPRLTVPVYAAVLVLTHLTGFQQAMSQHGWIHDGEMVLYLVSGYLLLLPLVGDELTTDPPTPHLLRFFIIAICMFPDTLVGIVLMMTSTPLAPAYAAATALGIVPVLGPDGDYLGCLTRQAVAEALDDPDPPSEIADLVQRPTVLAADTPPQQILSALTGHGGTGLPVLNAEGTALIGWVTYESLLARMHPEIAAGSRSADGAPPSSPLSDRR